MQTIQTVQGPLTGTELGKVLVHEHVACVSAGFVRSWSGLAGGIEGLVSQASEAFAAAREAGISTIVDATPFDLGRDMRLLEAVAKRSGVTVIASTGHWLFPSLAMQNRSTSELARMFIEDLTIGADGSSIRCGVIKVASEDEVTPFDRRVLEAAAIAHRETGAPILTHAAARNRIGEAQATVFEELGVAPDRVVIGHADDTHDITYLTGLTNRGFIVGMDRIPCGALEEYGGRTVRQRIDAIAELIGMGKGNQIVVSHDDPVWAGVLSERDQARHLAANPHQLTFISRVVLPALRAAGVGEVALDALLVANPRRWLLGSST